MTLQLDCIVGCTCLFVHCLSSGSQSAGYCSGELNLFFIACGLHDDMPARLLNAVIQIGVTKCWIDVGCRFEYFWV